MQNRQPQNEMKKCHSHHMKIYANRHIKITVSIPPEESEAFIGMANILAEGCVADLVYETSKDRIRELLEDAEVKQQLEKA